MTGLSLFSGIGGFDLAFESAGGHVAAMCEIDPFCRSVLRKHWPDVPVFENVKTLRGEQVGAVDVIFGGFPCQPFSVAGEQKGRDDDRYLWPEFSRLVGEIKPLWVVAENVLGIINLAADDVCSDLERHGYEVGIWCYEAASVGAPHRRARVFFVAHARNPASNQILENTGRWMREGRSIQGAFCREHEQWAVTDNKRPSNAPVAPLADADCEREQQQSGNLCESGGRIGNGGEDVPNAASVGRDGGSVARPGEHQGRESEGETGRLCGAVADADSEGLQGRERGKLRQCACEWTFGESGTFVADAKGDGRQSRRPEPEGQRGESGAFGHSGREPESRLGGVANGLPAWMDGDWWTSEPDIPRVAKGIPNRVQRLKALGNAVVPAQAQPIFEAIMQVEFSYLREVF